MEVPLLSPSGSLLAFGWYVDEAFTTFVTVNTVEFTLFLRLELTRVQMPSAAVMHVTVPFWVLNVPLTVAPATATPFASKTVMATCGCHFFDDEVELVALSRSPT